MVQRQGADTVATYTVNGYGDGTAGYALGAVTSSSATTTRNGLAQPATSTATSYAWYDGAVQAGIAHTPNTSQPGTVFTTTHAYTAFGALASATITDGRPRTVSFVTDVAGQVIRRDEADNTPWNPSTYQGGDPHRAWYRFDGKGMGDASNDDWYDHSYAGSVADRTHARLTGSTNGAFRYGATLGFPTTSFDDSLTPVDTYQQGSAAAGYTVRSGDTLAGIAANLWGDASLWYKLAQANGIGGDSGLIPGMTLAIPAGVMRNTHNASTFAPYDPTDAYGDTSPTTPNPQAAQAKKKGNKCGLFGQVLLVAVAVAVTALSHGALAALGPIGSGAAAGAAGSIASQGVGLATGIQDKFSFKQVALAGLGGGVGGAIGGDKLIGGIANKTLSAAVNGGASGFIGNIATQGVALATGLQSKFDFAGVAAAAVGGAAGGALGVQNLKLSRSAASAVTGTARAVANAAARSLIQGSDFGDNLIRALPDVIGQTVGGFVADLTNGGVAREVAAGRAAAAEKARGLQIAVDPSVFQIDDGIAGAGAPLVGRYRYVSSAEHAALTQQARDNAVNLAGPIALPSTYLTVGGPNAGQRSDYVVQDWQNAVRLTGGSLGYYQGQDDGTAPYVRLLAAEAKADATLKADLKYLGKAYATEVGWQIVGGAAAKYALAPAVRAAAPYLGRAASVVRARAGSITSNIVSRFRAAERGGARFGLAASNDYRATFFAANPELKGQVVVHHAVEQQTLKLYPTQVTAAEINSLENLRGIPLEINSKLHLSTIRKEWNRFYLANPDATKAQLLQKATELDMKYGTQFHPPLGR